MVKKENSAHFVALLQYDSNILYTLDETRYYKQIK